MTVKKTLTLTDWIVNNTVKDVARVMKVTEATVRHWRIGRCLPRPEQMQRIKTLTKGALTCDKMISDFHTALPPSRKK